MIDALILTVSTGSDVIFLAALGGSTLGLTCMHLLSFVRILTICILTRFQPLTHFHTDQLIFMPASRHWEIPDGLDRR